MRTLANSDGLAVALIVLDSHSDRDDLVLELARLDGFSSLLVRQSSELILLLARNTESLGNILRGLTHIKVASLSRGVLQCLLIDAAVPPVHRVGRHRLNASSNANLIVSSLRMNKVRASSAIAGISSIVP